MTGLVLSDDLVFVSRIAATAQAAGLVVRQARAPAELLALAAKDPPRGVILDLQNPGLDLTALLAELRSVCPAMPRVTAYGSHVEADLLRSARDQAGDARVDVCCEQAPEPLPLLGTGDDVPGPGDSGGAFHVRRDHDPHISVS